MTTHVNDARAFFRQATPGYDLVVFGYLDSQALSSTMANIRLDGFVYTMESMRTAFGLLDDDGLLSVSFAAHGHEWLVKKLIGMVTEATGQAPLNKYATAFVFDSFDLPRLVKNGDEVSLLIR